MSAANSEKPEYIAFISYRHADNREQDRCWATWLHRALETYVIPPDLIGTTNLRGGKVPQSIYPVFRDEEEFSAEASLAPAIQDALQRSHFLIVLCSPKSVQSPYVAEEIRHFKRLGRADKIIPVLLDGEPGHPNREAFPEPLRVQYEEDGTIRKETVEPLAADFRLADATEGYTSAAAYARQLRDRPEISSKDREQLVAAYRERSQLAFLKIVAAVLAVPLATVTKRDLAHQLAVARKRARIFLTVAAALTILLVVAVGTGLYANRKRIEATKARDSANDLVGFMLTDLHDQLSETGRLDVLSSAVEKVDQHLANNPVPPHLVADLRLQQARILFGQGRLAEAVDRARKTLMDLPEDPSTRSRRAKLHAFLGDVLAWDSASTSAAKEECLKALGLFDPAAMDPSAIEALVRTHIALGDIQRDDNEVSQALDSYRFAWDLAGSTAPDLDEIRALAGQRMAEVRHLNNDSEGSSVALESVLELADAHLQKSANSHPWLVIRAETLRLRSVIEQYSGQTAASVASLREAEAHARQTATPGQLHRQFLLAMIEGQLAAHPSPELTIPQREKLFSSSLDAQRSLLQEDRNNRGWAAKLASTLRDHAGFELDLSELFKDTAFRNNALLDLKDAALLLDPIDLPGTLRERAETYLTLAAVDIPANRESHLSHARELVAKMPAGDVDTILLDGLLILRTETNIDPIMHAHGRILSAWEKAAGIRKSALTWQLADSHLRLAAVASEKADADEFLAQSDRALSLLESVRIAGGDQPNLDEKIALTLGSRAKTLQSLQLSAQSKQTYQDALVIFRKLAESYPDYAPPFREISLAEYQLGKIETSAGNPSEAVGLLHSSFEHYLVFIRNAALEAPRPPSPMSLANLIVLKAISERQAEAAVGMNKPETEAEAWSNLFKICKNVDVSSFEASDQIGIQKIQTDSLAGAVKGLSKLSNLSTDQSVLAASLIKAAEGLHSTQPQIHGLDSLKQRLIKTEPKE